MIHSKSFRLLSILTLAVLLLTTLTGCYWNQTVESSRVGIQMNDGVSVDAVVGPGRYTNMAAYATMVEADTSNKTITWNDPSLVTKDKQPIGMTLTLTYARKSDSDSIKAMFLKYRAELGDDRSLETLVVSRVPEVAKSVSTKFSLDQLIGIDPNISRDSVSNEIENLLKQKLDEVFVELVSVQLADVAPSASYMDLLNQKAAAQIQVELAMQQSKTLAEKLNQEKAQTDIDVEIARRKNLVTAELAKAYTESPEMLELRKLEMLAEVIGPNDKFFYLPVGSDISSVVLGNGNIVPVVP